MLSKYLFPITLVLFCATTGRAQITLNAVPTREIGQPRLLSNTLAVPNANPNLVEGRELYGPTGIALDNSVTPPRIYVADTANNRVLAWKDAVNFTNGKMADLVIGQLPGDFYSTVANGPGRASSTLSTGFTAPTGLAVDQGDLYVADSGNNRILRFKKPFDTPPDQLSPDLCIGQPSFNTNSPNYPLGPPATPTANGIALNYGGNTSPFIGAIAFDPKTHDLWLADAGNNRVLMYAAADVARGGFATTISASLQLGQPNLTSKYPPLPSTAEGVQNKSQLATPAAIAFDPKGNLYVADSDTSFLLNRVLVYLPPFTDGKSASRVMGAHPANVAGAPLPTDPQIYSIAMFNPSAIFFLPGTQGMGVVDSGYSRILIFDPYDQWPDAATAPSPSAKAVFGHATGIGGISKTDKKSLYPNDGSPLAALDTVNNPQAAVFFNNELYLADWQNNRVVVLPWQNGSFKGATRVLGQDRFNTNSINLIEGREFYFFNPNNPNTRAADAAVVMDSTGDTPHLYVADPYNNRVLGFRDVRKLVPGSAADIVIGQRDLATAVCNYPAGDILLPTQSSLCHPIGLLVDSNGNLYVADSLNGRVLRFPTPFSHQDNQLADLVLGKPNFSTPYLIDASARNMYVPYGLTFAGANGLLVSDQALNRVLYFPFTNGGFTSADNGAAATKVLGQPDFTSKAAGNSDSGMSSPHHLSTDTDGRPYVVDTGNGRVAIFDQILKLPATGAHASFLLPAGGAEGIFVDSTYGSFWVTDLNNAVRKYPRYDQCIFNCVPLVTIQSDSPVAVTQDPYGDLIVAEAYNRVTFYYPTLSTVNGASFQLNNKPLAPNTVASIFPVPSDIPLFGKDTATASDQSQPLPLAMALANIQVTVNGTSAPLYYVSPGQINFVMPWNAPTTGTADVQVLNTLTGQLLAAGRVPMNTVSPAIFVVTPAPATVRLAAVSNQNGTPNDATHPAKRGEYISIYATGQGMVSSPPADGDIPRNGLVGAQGNLRVIIGTDYTDQIPLQGSEQRSIPGVDTNFIEFSGLSPAYPGVWQVNVRVPQATAAGAAALSLVVDSFADNSPRDTGYRVVFYVQ